MKVEITNGQNIIQLLFDEFASCLVIETALTVNWPDCAGSVGEYYALSSYSSHKRKSLTDDLNQVLINGDEKDVFESIREFLELFSNGNYNVNKGSMKLDACNFMYEDQVKWSENVDINSRFSGAFYPFPFDRVQIFFTVPNSSINKERVKFYKELIQSGSRPLVVTYDLYSPQNADYTACYLIDGHHKTKAYIELGIDIPTISITKTEEVKGQTQAILNASVLILKDFEFEHFLTENDENLKNVNFTDEPLLTSKLDHILLSTKRIKNGIVNLLINMDTSNEPLKSEWLSDRLINLSKNKNIGNGLMIVYWAYDEIKDTQDLTKWIKKTLPNTTYS